jgi:hypothetical protein
MRVLPSARAFTLAELMVAVAVLIVIIVATAKIFGIAGRVAGLGEATSDVMQEAATIERQLREDFKRLSDDGFIVVRCVRVRNDINLNHPNYPGPLLNPARRPGDFLRCDQLFFFVDGAQHMATLGTRGSNIRGLGVASRVYWGHGIQLALKQASGDPTNVMLAHDYTLDFENPLLPWHRGPWATEWRRYRHDSVLPTAPDADYTWAGSGGSSDATQPSAPSWLLARHAVVLADDGDEYPDRFMYGNRTARWIDQHPIWHGRVDGAAQTLQDVQRLVTVAPAAIDCDNDGTPEKLDRPWFDPGYGPGDQRSVVAALAGRGVILDDDSVVWGDLPVYTRAERIAPGMNRVDQALTNHVIGNACSSFRIDWTWGPGTGELRDGDGNFVKAPWLDPDDTGDDVLLTGVRINADQSVPAYREQPWFGLEDPDRGVYMYGTGAFTDLEPDLYPWWSWAPTIAPDNVERIVYPPGNVAPDEPLVVYEAIFGYNRGAALNDDGNPDFVIYFTNDPDCSRVGYTPWPSAIRITMTLHDQQQRFGEGREIQFVVDLPRRQ